MTICIGRHRIKDAETDQRADKGYSEKPLPGDRQAGAAAGEPERLVEPPH